MKQMPMEITEQDIVAGIRTLDDFVQGNLD